MNPNPQPTPTSAPPAGEVAAEPLVEFIRTQRQNAGYVLLALSAALLGLTIWLAVKSFRAPAAPAPEQTAEKADPLAPEPPRPEVTDPNRGDYIVGWIGSLAAFLVTASVGAWLLVGLPDPDPARQRTQARVAVLVVGGLLGMLLIAFGGVYFYRWSEALTAWLDRGEAKEMKWVIYPLLMVIAGAGLVFAALQPARAEERNNTLLRRLVYGSNFGLTVLLLFVVLVAANVVLAMRVPNRLDTTATGFYSLSQPTEAFLAQLDQPVNAYAILPDTGERLVSDIRRLLQSCQDASGGRFRVRFISPVLNKADLAALQAKYTQLEVNAIGVLLTVGEDEKRYTFIRAEEFLDRDSPMTGRQTEPAFAGESKLLRELMFLAENRQRPVVYFTQSAGELDIGGGFGADAAAEERSGAQLKAFLEKNYLDVRPLKFDPVAPKIPDDAEVIVVAAPRSPFPPAAAEALQKFMTEPRPGGKKGKMVVLAGAPDPRTARKVAPTGLEPLLSGFNVTLGDKYVFGLVSGQPLLLEMPTAFTDSAIRARNSIALTLRRFQMNLVFPREVTAAPQGNPEYRATALLGTLADYTWLEEEFPDDPRRMIADLPRKQVTDRTRVVGVVVADSAGTARLAVYGSGLIASDFWAQQTRGTAPVEFDLIGVTIDWLRDRPPVPTGVTAKTYTNYTFPPKVDTGRILWFPLGLAVLVVAGLGAGVWVIRRK